MGRWQNINTQRLYGATTIYNTLMRKTSSEELQDTLIIQALLPAGETVP